MKPIDLDLRKIVGHCCFYLFGHRPFYYIGYMEGWYSVKPFSPGPTWSIITDFLIYLYLKDKVSIFNDRSIFEKWHKCLLNCLKGLLRRSCWGGDWIRRGVILRCNTYTHLYHPIHRGDHTKNNAALNSYATTVILLVGLCYASRDSY